MHFRLSPRWVTLNDLELTNVRIFLEFPVILQICEATTTRGMKTDPYCQRQNCSQLKVLRCIDFVDIAMRFSGRLGPCNHHTVGEMAILTFIRDNILQTVSNTATTINRKSHMVDLL